jgi:hypothetical protein
MAENPNLIDDIYNVLEPYKPLPAGDRAYVEFGVLRGDENILLDLGNRIWRSRNADRMTCQLYSGHRGAGKSTELLRLQAELKQKGCFVVYFAADEKDINIEDVEYADILLACTRHLLEQLKTANSQPLRDWLRARWEDLKDLALTEVSFDSLSVESQINQYAKLTTQIRLEPTLRSQIREKVNPHTTTLIEALNQFIADGKRNLPDGKTQLVVIVDSLEKMAPIYRDNGRSSHEEIFLDRAQQLKALDCHLIYTVPTLLLYSKWSNEVKEEYGYPQVLPMVMVRTREGAPYPAGLQQVKNLLIKRIAPLAPDKAPETEIFDAPATLERLCLISGGHIRELLLLAQEAVNRTTELPISAQLVQRAITEARSVLSRSVEESEWEILARISKTKEIRNDNQHRSLLFNRCVMEYRYMDDQNEKQTWYDVHPLIKDMPQFKAALDKLKT